MDGSRFMNSKYFTWITILVSLLVVIAHSIYIFPWMLDDAFISFRYVQNFVSGHGLVYNAGERVEGYTTFLWVVLLSLGRLLGMNIVILSKVLGAAFAFGCLLLVAHAFRFMPKVTRQQAGIATLFLGTSGVFTPWAISGMEVTMFTFSVTLTVLAFIRAKSLPGAFHFAAVGALAGVTALIRPEGLPLFAVLALFQLVTDRRRFVTTLLYMVGVFAVIYAPYFVWRYHFYGYLLPNTFYAKVGDSFSQVERGVDYAYRFGRTTILPILAVIAAVVSGRWFRRFPGLGALLSVIAVYSIYVVAVGGDVMPAFRFFTPILPLVCLVSALALACFRWLRTTTALVLAVLVIVGYNLSQLRLNDRIYTQIKTDTAAFYGEKVGLWLKANAVPDAIVATNTAGSIPYFSGLKTIDMMGMNDVHIAHRQIPSMGRGLPGHEKGDGAYVLSRNPDYIILGSSLGSAVPFRIFLSDVEIYQDSLFRQNYVLSTYRLDSGEPLQIYERQH
jgi:arabinofuranosyltransferase